MTVTAARLAPDRQWDTTMLEQLFTNELWPAGLEFTPLTVGYPHTEGCVLLIPGRYWHTHTDDISEALSRYTWVLAMRVGDEEDLFDIHRIEHPNLKWWVQTPRIDRDYGDARLFGVGYPPHFTHLQPVPPPKMMDVFLSGQANHPRRSAVFDRLHEYPSVHATAGFTQGLDNNSYAARMVNTRIAPAPAGRHTADTFRLYEALEAHCVPIADDVAANSPEGGYWRMLFPDCPFPVYRDIDDLPGYIEDQLALWPRNVNEISAWWIQQKKRMADWLVEDLKQLGAV